MKKYQIPEIEVTVFETEDILVKSSLVDTDGGYDVEWNTNRWN